MPSETRRYLRVEVVGDVAVVGFTNRDVVFQPKDVQELDSELHRLIDEEGRTKVLLNLSGVQYLSSSMLVKLISLKKTMEHAQGRLKLCCLAPVMRDTFRVSKLEPLFEIFDDEAGALAHF